MYNYKSMSFLRIDLEKITIFVAGGGIILLVLLSPLGYWVHDDFYLGISFDEQGVKTLRQRVLGWSPRPFSELLIYLYHMAVGTTGLQLITPFLILLWGGFLVAAFWPLRLCSLLPRKTVCAYVLTLLFLIVFDINHVEKFLYATVAAAAYMPTMAGVILVAMVILLANVQAKSHYSLILIGLIIAAASSEVGLFFSLFFSIGMIFYALLSKNTSSYKFLIVLGFSLWILYRLAKGRMGHVEAVEGVSVHDFWESLLAAFSIFPSRIFLWKNVSDTDFWVVGFVVKLLFFAASFKLFSLQKTPEDKEQHIILPSILVFSALSAAFALPFSCHYTFGAQGITRHFFMENFYIWLAIAALAKLAAAHSMDKWLRHKRIASTFLFFTVAVTASVIIVPVYQQYARFGVLLNYRDILWSSGMSPSPEQPLIKQHYTGDTIFKTSGLSLPVGVYHYQQEYPIEQFPVQYSIPDPYMKYFKKDKMIVYPEP